MRTNRKATLLLLAVSSSELKKKKEDNAEFHFAPTKTNPITHLLQ